VTATLLTDRPHQDAKHKDVIEQEVLAHIKADFVSDSAGALEAETSLEGVVDSTAIMELVVWIEDRFKFSVELDDITPDNFGSVRHLALWIARNTTGEGA
jgi:acyl carrier protein